MEEREISLFARIEREHFFYRGRREVVRHWLRKLFPARVPKPILIDAGAGTGILLEELAPDYDAIGSDLYFDPSVSVSKNKILRADAYSLPFPDRFADAVIALDLLEHLERDAAGLLEFARITRPGGYVMINVPAFALLFSDWDQAVGHQRRYRKQMVRALAETAGLEIIFINYVNSAPFFPILIYRQIRTRFKIGKSHRLEDQLPPSWFNRLLLWALIQQGKYSRLNLPFGVSLFAVLKKPAGNLSADSDL